MPGWLRVAAMRCQERLHRFGKTIEDATSFLLEHLENAEKSCGLADLLVEFGESAPRIGMTKRRLRFYRLNVGRLIEVLGPKKIVSQTKTKEIDAFLEGLAGLAPKSRNDIRRMLVSFFNFAKKRGYTPENPVPNSIQFREIETPVGILSPDQIANLLEAAAGTPLLPFVAIGAFAGLRRAEILRLDWSEIDLEENFIEVTAAKSKTASRRVVTILPCLREWLFPYAKLSGKVIPWCVPEAWEALFHARTRAGIYRVAAQRLTVFVRELSSRRVQ